MITQEQYTRIARSLPILHQADARLVDEFQGAAFLAKISAGKDVFIEGDRANAIALLISGIVRV
ncbi:MAG: hypothetical protein HN560_15300 [Anaerolineae bacterium]|jgi:hypothetical protein|nr:hypothetical protein [Anaerolineae bacterium]MBT7192192.1 hypothetical protein [Anaerolineae bacterium]MBT7602422.1 hypothetical protein [Anaerolineae bacterium]